MAFFEFSQTGSAILTLTVVAIMFILFIRETFPTEVVAITGAALMLGLGLLPYEDALLVLSNPAPWTIAAMFIIMGALVRTGALEAFTGQADRIAQTNPALAIVLLMTFVVLSSAIVSNTPVVVVMIPVFVQLAKTMGIASSKMLIPKSQRSSAGLAS